MKILDTIKELSHNYRVPIRLGVEPDGTIKIYVDNNEVDHMVTNNLTTEDFIRFFIRECIEIYFRR